MSLLLSVKNLSKVYKLNKAEMNSFRETFRSIFNRQEQIRNEFFALNLASFDLSSGEILGITGPNGAGKSTLLKILSEVTYPTSGEVEIFGRVASMLEIGTGFHPELTGRENVFFNASLLGMNRAETEHKFDQILAFSEIGEFIDTPIKRYSSGMYVRLAFSVAIHTHVDLFLIDEVLAVGDINFQEKCKDKMKELSAAGAGIILVSHNQRMLEEFTSRLLLIEGGEIIFDGNTNEGLKLYDRKLDQEVYR